MSKLKQFLFAGSSMALLLAVPIPASATDECTITNTGPGSVNECEIEQEFTCTVQNDTVIIVNSEGEQVASSGDSNTDGNTNGGGATSGSATNDNGTSFEFEINNDGCVVTAVTEPKPEAPVRPRETTPPVGGRGAAGPVTPVATPTVLPNTGNDIFLAVAAGVTAAGGAGLLALRTISRFGSR